MIFDTSHFEHQIVAVVVGDRRSTVEAETTRYTELLLRDISISTSGDACLSTLNTIYFGGGTPSLLSPSNIGSILRKMTDTFGLSDDCEITLEVDPGTFDESFLQAVHSLGVNRLSVGIQSFDDDVLKKCGRAHTAAQAIDAIEKIHRSAINNFSIDLISSLPFLTLDKWESTLRAATDTGSTHMSIYDLQVEDKTAFGRWYSPGVFPLPGDAESAEMYRAGVRTLTAAGYEHYEISNYAKPGHRSRHNQKYWRCEPVWGFGMAAASLVGGRRATRPRSMAAYRTWVDRSEARTAHTRSPPLSPATPLPQPLPLLQSPASSTFGGQHPIDGPPSSPPLPVLTVAGPVVLTVQENGEGEEVGERQEGETGDRGDRDRDRDGDRDRDRDRDRDGDVDGDGEDGDAPDVLEVVMLALRTAEGLDLDDLATRFGPHVATATWAALRHISHTSFSSSSVPLVALEGEEVAGAEGWGRRCRLTDPEGFLVSNDIISSVFAALEGV